MSNLKVATINDASGGSNAVLYGVAAPVGSMGNRNRIINGDMRIDQRNAGASVTTSSGTTVYTLDRWQAIYSQTSKFTVQRNAGSVTPPAGFTNYLGITSSSAYSVGASEQFNIHQIIEGFNVADLGWGAAGAQSVTLSFWVRSSLTGTFGGVLLNDGKSRAYPFTYTISAANTWEQKTVTIAGDTSGTWKTDTSAGVFVSFGLGVGSTVSATAGSWTGAGNIFGATGATSVVGTNGATFYITGVQLEAGSVASPFERIDYGRQLIQCQRYYQVLASGANQPLALGGAYTATSVYATIPLRVSMRAAPTLSATSGTNYYIFYRNGSSDSFNSLTLEVASTDAVEISSTADLSGTIGYAGMVRTQNAASFVAVTSEL